MVTRRTAITGTLATAAAVLTPGIKASALTGIPQIPDTTIAFGHVDESGVWTSFSTPVPDDAMIIGYQYDTYMFWPITYNNYYPNSGWALQNMPGFAPGDMRVWYRLPDWDMGESWPRPHPIYDTPIPELDGMPVLMEDDNDG